jgi:hypothetical protein
MLPTVLHWLGEFAPHNQGDQMDGVKVDKKDEM